MTAYIGDAVRAFVEIVAQIDHIREHDIACWNSMIAPRIFHPTILRPFSAGWEVEIMVRIQRSHDWGLPR